MATFKAVVLKPNAQGRYNVKIRVTHLRKNSYVATEFYRTKTQLTKDLELKDDEVKKEINKRIDSFYETMIKLSGRIDQLTAVQLAEYLNSQNEDTSIDFVKFSLDYIERVKKRGQSGTSENLMTALRSFKDYYGADKIYIADITTRKLDQFADYLKTERKVKRVIKGKEQELTLKPMQGVGVRDALGRIRQLFLAAQDEYNDEDRGDFKIKHNPFRKFKMPVAPAAKKRNIQVDDVIKVRDFKPKKPSLRVELAKDILMLVFYLAGINTVDLYNATILKDNRLVYNRTKTKRRKDQALTSIRIEPEVLPLIEKYKDETGQRVFKFYQMYKEPDYFNTAVNDGAKVISDELKFPERLTTYFMRHSWATIGRNVCRISKDDIHFALNHSDPDMKITDLYIQTDWSIIDDANRKVLNTLKK